MKNTKTEPKFEQNRQTIKNLRSFIYECKSPLIIKRIKQIKIKSFEIYLTSCHNVIIQFSDGNAQ